ncbi:MAG: holo-[acyl-carrier-protein] synthase [Candidatus Marinimicrobia bacterium]|nr:holo-[acyl-carrier-protein] synthase [Candidatus Neomarinimicrobiota bacterium]
MEASDIFLGNDLVEVSRILSSIDKIGQRFIDRIYTKHEQDYCNSKSKPEIHFAGRFAAKEAVIKALKSSGFKKPTPFNLIEIKSGSDGEPIVRFDFPCEGQCKVSISHTENHAIASAIFISE